jgi:hypothetical protein
VTNGLMSWKTSTEFTHGHAWQEESGPEPMFEAHALVPTLDQRPDRQPQKPRRSFTSSRGSRGAAGTSQRSTRLLEDDDFTLEEQRGAEFAGGRTPSRIDVRTASKRSGGGTYGSESIFSSFKHRNFRPITVFAKNAKRPPLTDAARQLASNPFRVAARRGGTTASYYRRSHGPAWRAKQKPILTASERRARRLALEQASRSGVRGRRSRGDVSRRTLAAITNGALFSKSALP